MDPALGVPEHTPVATLGLPYDAAVRVAERLAHGPAQRLAAAALIAFPAANGSGADYCALLLAYF